MPTASFRFHLTMDTLAVQLYISHYLGMFRTFTCESAPMARKRNVRRQAHHKKCRALFCSALFLSFILVSYNFQLLVLYMLFQCLCHLRHTAHIPDQDHATKTVVQEIVFLILFFGPYPSIQSSCIPDLDFFPLSPAANNAVLIPWKLSAAGTVSYSISSPAAFAPATFPCSDASGQIA
mgnify:CR=1 FL=1